MNSMYVCMYSMHVQYVCMYSMYVCMSDGYLHIDDVVVDARLVFLQHLKECGYIFTGGEELQVGLGNSQD